MPGRLSLFGGGHEAVLDAEHNKGVLAAAGCLLQQFSRGQRGGLAADPALLRPPRLAVALGQAPALGIRAVPDALLRPGRVKGGGCCCPTTLQSPFPQRSLLHSPSRIPQHIPAIEGEDAGAGSQRGPSAREQGFPVIEQHFVLGGRVGNGAGGGLALPAPQEHPRSSKPQQPLGRGRSMTDGGFGVICIPDLGRAGLMVGLLKRSFPTLKTPCSYSPIPRSSERRGGFGDTRTRRLTMGTAARSALRTML